MKTITPETTVADLVRAKPARSRICMKRDSQRPLVDPCADASGVAPIDDPLAAGFDSPKTAAASTSEADAEPSRELSSPVCYLPEFQDW